jgi:hypothetical protein
MASHPVGHFCGDRTKMNQDQFLAVVRNLLIPAAGFAAGYGIDGNTWALIVSAISYSALMAWGVWQHDATQDMMLSVVRSIVGAFAGYFIQKGWIDSNTGTMLAAGGMALVPNIWTWFVHADPKAVTPPKVAMLLIGIAPAKMILAIALGLSLASCATIKADIASIEVIASGSVSPQKVLVAANAFDAAETTGTNYLGLPVCPQGAPACRTPAIVAIVVKSIRSGRSARNQLEAYMTAHPGSVVPVSYYNALATAIKAIQNAVSGT